MNSSTIVKRTLPLLIVLLLIIGITISCTVFKKDNIVPTISDEDGIYLSISEGNRTYNIIKKDMYDKLKPSYGLHELLNKIDRDLLKVTKKGESNYWDSVTQTEIDEAIEKTIFPDGKEDLTEEEITKEKTNYEEDMYLQGYRSIEEIENYHRLILAKKAYAIDNLTKLIEDTDKLAKENKDLEPYFTEEDYKTYYKANYLNGYWTIVVPFSSQTEADIILEQLGIKLHKKDPDNSSDFDKWVKVVDGEEVALTASEIAKAFIDMYNTVNAHKLSGYPLQQLTLVEGVHYTIEDEVIKFKTDISEVDENLNILYYTNKEMASFNGSVEKHLKDSMLPYNENETKAITKDTKWYTPVVKVYDNNKLFTYILKIKEQNIPVLEDVKEEIYQALFDQKITDDFINGEMAKLRVTNGLVIYDQDIEKDYISQLESLDTKLKLDVTLKDSYNNHVKTYTKANKLSKEKQSVIIALIESIEYTADDLFKLLDTRYGLLLVTREIDFLRMLNNSDFNKIYDYYSEGLTQGQRVIDKKKWEDIRSSVVIEKNNFLGGAYSQYGIGPTYGWKNFLRDVHGVTDVEGLMYKFLADKVKRDYAESLGDISKADELNELWKIYQDKMDEIKNDYFSVEAIQLLITVKDEDGNILDPEKWTDLQNEYALELYDGIWDYVFAESGEYSEKLQKFVKKYQESPLYLAGVAIDDQPVLAEHKYVLEDGTSYNIEISKYKSAGLNVEFNNIGAFTNATTTKENAAINDKLKEIAKEIWDKNVDKPSTSITYGYEFGQGVTDYLKTENGYHIYINTKTNEIKKWNYVGEEEKYILPTLQMVKTHLIDSVSTVLLDEEGNKTEIEFTADMKAAVTTYFTPVKNELVGNTKVSINLYEQMKNLGLDFKLSNYSKDEYIKVLDLVIQTNKENLKYFNVQE